MAKRKKRLTPAQRASNENNRSKKLDKAAGTGGPGITSGSGITGSRRGKIDQRAANARKKRR